jgi:hypothetical protein
LSIFFWHVVSRPLPTLVAAARLSAAAAVLAALDVVTGLVVNGYVDAEVREPWSRYLPSAAAVIAFSALSVALMLRAAWARIVTFVACGIFSILTLLDLVILVDIQAVGATPAVRASWYFPFQCAIALLNVILYIMIIIILARPTGDDAGINYQAAAHRGPPRGRSE